MLAGELLIVNRLFDQVEVGLRRAVDQKAVGRISEDDRNPDRPDDYGLLGRAGVPDLLTLG